MICLEEVFAGITLQRGKFEFGFPVVPYYKLYGAVAQIADAIK
jgi:hypothetical protein